MHETEATSWSDALARIRRELGCTTQQMARRVGIAPSQLGAIERGQLLPDSKVEALLRKCFVVEEPAEPSCSVQA